MIVPLKDAGLILLGSARRDTDNHDLVWKAICIRKNYPEMTVNDLVAFLAASRLKPASR
jgi:hypothetical protein